MLSQKPEESISNMNMMPQPVVASAPVVSDEAAVQALMEVISASPDFQASFDDFLTSPMEDSPFDDFLTTPSMPSSEFLTSPAIVDADDFGFDDAMPLFGGGSGYNPEQIKTASAHSHTGPSPFDGLLTMSSPHTPALDPGSLHPSPNVGHSLNTPNTPAFSSLPRRKNQPTGTRKNITPESLVPYDAPVQSRNYITPSATSRKEVPAVFAKKRSRTQAFGDEEDQLAAETAALAPDDVDAIEAKRKQNTLAARRSRKRKLEYQRELEDSLEREREEKEHWKQRAMMSEALLISHGIQVPS